MTIGVREPQPAGVRTDRASWSVHAFTERGDRRGDVSGVADVSFRSVEGTDTVSYNIRARMPLKPGLYELRVAVSSNSARQMGSVYVHVEVPDFDANGVQMSHVVLGAEGERSGATADAADLIPVVPTLDRAFGRADRVTAFARVTTGRDMRAPVVVKSWLTDAADRTIEEATESLTTDKPGAIAWRRELPLASLASGAYLLTVEASDGHATVHRAIPLIIAR